ncbi:MAG: CRP/FNR family cyclic AMP-dependent transcriptional regulator, partial [Thermoproteota archaeon]
AIVSTDIIEISFIAFGKTMEALNPWFKTIINTLANRLRKTNARVKQLESNSVAVDYGSGKASGYEFLKVNDIIKILGTLFLVFKSHGDDQAEGIKLHRRVLDLYANEIYTLGEAKVEALMQLLKELNYLEFEMDQDNLPQIMVVKSLQRLRALFIFFNTEKHLTEDKKLKITKKAQDFLTKITEDKSFNPKSTQIQLIPIQAILDDYKLRNVFIGLEQLGESKEAGITSEIIVGSSNELAVEVFPQKLARLLPIMEFCNAIGDLNESRAKH